MKKAMISILTLAVLANILASDPDSGKKFHEEYEYLTNMNTGEHYLHTDTIYLELNKTTWYRMEHINRENKTWQPSMCLPPCAWYFKNDQLQNWRSRDDYIRIEDGYLTLIQEFDGIFRIEKDGGLYSASAYIGTKPETVDTSDSTASDTTSQDTSIHASSEIAICKYFDPNNPLDTLYIKPNETIKLCLRSKTGESWGNPLLSYWKRNFCEHSNDQYYGAYPEISCSEPGTGYITGVSGDEQVTLVIVFQDPVKAIKSSKFINKNKEIKFGAFSLNGRAVRKQTPKPFVYITGKTISVDMD